MRKCTFAQKRNRCMIKYIVFIFICCSLKGIAQEKKMQNFVPPFDFPLTFSGNFGELRANHFHGGLDFKTGGVTGKPVRALGNGYISRIRVTNGSGYVLDVCYDNGYSTINRHLQSFLSPIADRVKQLQYEKESWEIEIIPEPNEYPVKAGQQIAWSGNTGYSFGPHLHLDVLETESGDYVDPMPFFLSKVKDTRPPKAESIMLFPQWGKGVVEGQQEQIAFSLVNIRPIEAWGVIGVGIKAYDYMDGVSNHYGVYSVSLAVDGKEMFRSTVNRFSQEENRMINSWTYGQYMKSFIEPGNTLRMLKTFNGNRGLVTIDEERDYHFVYTLKDVFGNTSYYRFVIHGREQSILQKKYNDKYFFAWDRTNYLHELGLSLVVPKGVLYDNVLLKYKMSTDSTNNEYVSYIYQLTDHIVPLHTACDLQIGLRRKPLTETTKYYVACITPKGTKYSVGGKYENGYIKTKIFELGTYVVAIDTIAPEVVAINKQQWRKNGKIIYKIKDKETGISSYRGTIDGKYALFGRPNITKPYWEYKIDPKYVKKGKEHIVELTVTDECGNTKLINDRFFW